MRYRIDSERKFTVVGYGSWATAIMKILLEKERKVGWYISNDHVREHLARRGNNPKYLRDIHFDSQKIHFYGDLNRAVDDSDVIILAVPSAYLQTMLQPLTVSLHDKFIISAIKGIVPDGLLTVAEYINHKYQVPFDRIGIITGPCHSEEVALERLSYLTLVCKDPENARQLCGVFENEYIRTVPSTDIYGAEYASVLKNIYAICAGMAVGLGYGDNFLAVLVSNASIEMNRFMSTSFDFDRQTNASAYLGDLLVTCYSQFSRNRTFGAMVGKGYRISSAMAEMKMVAEGYFAADCIHRIMGQHDIEMPIAECVYRVLYEEAPVAEQIRKMTEKLI